MGEGKNRSEAGAKVDYPLSIKVRVQGEVKIIAAEQLFTRPVVELLKDAARKAAGAPLNLHLAYDVQHNVWGVVRDGSWHHMRCRASHLCDC